jgi:hypothetical protein
LKEELTGIQLCREGNQTEKHLQERNIRKEDYY